MCGPHAVCARLQLKRKEKKEQEKRDRAEEREDYRRAKMEEMEQMEENMEKRNTESLHYQHQLLVQQQHLQQPCMHPQQLQQHQWQQQQQMPPSMQPHSGPPAARSQPASHNLSQDRGCGRCGGRCRGVGGQLQRVWEWGGWREWCPPSVWQHSSSVAQAALEQCSGDAQPDSPERAMRGSIAEQIQTRRAHLLLKGGHRDVESGSGDTDAFPIPSLWNLSPDMFLCGRTTPFGHMACFCSTLHAFSL